MMKRFGVFFLAVGFAIAAFAADTSKVSRAAGESTPPEQQIPADAGPDRFEPTNPIERSKRDRAIAERVRKILAGIEGREGATGGGRDSGAANPGDK